MPREKAGIPRYHRTAERDVPGQGDARAGRGGDVPGRHDQNGPAPRDPVQQGHRQGDQGGPRKAGLHMKDKKDRIPDGRPICGRLRGKPQQIYEQGDYNTCTN